MSFYPNRTLFFLTLFILPWLTVGLQIGSVSIYLAFLIAATDVIFGFGLLTAICNRPFDRGDLFKLLLFLVVVIPWALRSDFAAKGVLKVFCASYFFIYLVQGFRKFPIWPLKLSCLVLFVLCVGQFYEANFLQSRILDIRKWGFRIDQTTIFGLGSDLGETYAPHLIKGIIRISGSAGEPGHLQSVLVCLLPILWFARSKSRDIASWLILVSIAVMFFFSLSKVGIIQLLSGLVILCLVALGGRYIVFYLLVITYAGTTIAAFKYFSPKSLLDYNSSIFERLNGGRLFFEFPLVNMLTGAGYSGTCSHLNQEILKVAEIPFGIVTSKTGITQCIAGSASFFGSLLLETGVFGVCILGIFLVQLATNKARNISQVALVSIFAAILGLQAVHFMTFYPTFIAALAFGAYKAKSAKDF